MKFGSKAAVFLISATSLLLEVLLTRILSIGQGYHFAFLVVSLALLGMGASGTVLAVLNSRVSLKKISNALLISLPVFFAGAVLANYFVLNHYFIDRYRLSLDLLSWLELGGFILALSTPFFFSGLILGLIFTLRAKEIGTYYAFDLLGAALGSLIFLPLAFLFPPHSLYGFLMVLALLVSFCFAVEAEYRVYAFTMGGFLTLFLILLTIFPLKPFSLSPYKSLSLALRYPESNNLMVRWNAYSQVNLIESPAARFAPGLSLTYEKTLPSQKGLAVDGSGIHGVTAWGGEKDSRLDFLSYLPTAVVYQLGAVKNVLIVNAGGGLSLLEAIQGGASLIEVVEKNPLVVEAVQKAFAFTPYQHSKVSLHLEDIRHYLSRTDERYDRIVISVTENPSAASNGLYGVSENYLFTRESFSEFWDHLAPDGILTLTRYLFFPQREEPRLTEMIRAVLAQKGIQGFKQHVIWIQTWGTSTLLVKKTAFSVEDLKKIQKFCERLGFEIVTSQYLERNLKDSLFDVSVPTDDRPFFFQFIKLSTIFDLVQKLKGRWDILLEGGLILWIVMGLAVVFCFLFILLPLVLQRRKSGSGSTKRSVLLYFLLLGLGFMFVEMALLHRSILLFSHPSFAVSFVLFLVLFSSGLGSFCLQKITLSRRFLYSLFSALAILILVFYGLADVLNAFLLKVSLGLRFLLLFVAFFPLGFLLGMPFASGIKSFAEHLHCEDLIPWAWGINATFSVLGATLSVILAMQWGYSVLFLLAAGCYLLCFVFIPALSPPKART